MIAPQNIPVRFCPRKRIFSQSSAPTNITIEQIPSNQEIADCYRFFDASDNIIRHCAKVAEIAAHLAKLAINHDYEIRTELLIAAAKLHDAARKRDQHEVTAAAYLHQHGYHTIADIISQHMRARPEFLLINEAALLFLADKLAKENREVTIAERYACAQQKYADNPIVLEEINYNINIAESIYEKIK